MTSLYIMVHIFFLLHSKSTPPRAVLTRGLMEACTVVLRLKNTFLLASLLNSSSDLVTAEQKQNVGTGIFGFADLHRMNAIPCTGETIFNRPSSAGSLQGHPHQHHSQLWCSGVTLMHISLSVPWQRLLHTQECYVLRLMHGTWGVSGGH